MPFYDYQCEGCGVTLERFQKMGEAPLATCPDCGGVLVRLLSPPAVIHGSRAPAGAGTGDGGAGPVIESRHGPVEVPWQPTETDIHRGWKQRRKWKQELVKGRDSGGS